MSTQRPAPRNTRNAQVSITQEQKGCFRLVKDHLPRSSNRARKGIYVVTHRGLARQLRLTQAYLALKHREFHELKIEIETMGRAGHSEPKLEDRAL